MIMLDRLHYINLKHTVATILLLLMGSIIYSSCKKDTVEPGGSSQDTTALAEMTPYALMHPPFFPEMQLIPDDNKMYLERVQLGRMLFFDNRLSNNEESCNTCHKQEYGFSVPGTSAFDKGLTSLPLINLGWYKIFMWNGRIIGSLEDVMESEINNRFKTDMAKINAISEYTTMFKKYYGVNVIDDKIMAKALAQYMRALISGNTKYELFVRGTASLNAFEEDGRKTFFSEKGDCFHCHVAVIATDNALHNNGLDTLYTKEIDKGYYNVTKNEADLGKFRTPNLRNVALRTDYMHDGRFKSLMEVIDFYDHGVHKVSNVDPIMLKPAKANGLNLTKIEKENLIDFLKTFTDPVMISDTMFTNPFK
jgi:cytochrome c peroxidase